MNSKSSICCIGLAVVIITTSFAAAVGFQTVKSNSAINSPLFVVRSKRAVDEENKVLTCKYVGKGITLPFPKWDDKTIMIQKVIDRISKMDDKTFEKFIVHIIDSAKKNNRFIGVNPDRIREAFYLLRFNDKLIPIFNADTENKHHLWTPGCTKTSDCFTFNTQFGIVGFLMCFLLLPSLLIQIILEWLYGV